MMCFPGPTFVTTRSLLLSSGTTRWAGGKVQLAIFFWGVLVNCKVGEKPWDNLENPS